MEHEHLQVFNSTSSRLCKSQGGKRELADLFVSKVVGTVTMWMRRGGGPIAWSVDKYLQEILAWIADNELETGSDDDDDKDLNMDKAIDTITTTAKFLRRRLVAVCRIFEGIA